MAGAALGLGAPLGIADAPTCRAVAAWLGRAVALCAQPAGEQARWPSLSLDLVGLCRQRPRQPKLRLHLLVRHLLLLLGAGQWAGTAFTGLAQAGSNRSPMLDLMAAMLWQPPLLAVRPCQAQEHGEGAVLKAETPRP